MSNVEKDINKLKKLIKELYENYDGKPFINDEWNEFIKEGYGIFFPKHKPETEEEMDKPCSQWCGPNPKSWACYIFCTSSDDCDGVKCKKNCDYHNKRGDFSYRK